MTTPAAVTAADGRHSPDRNVRIFYLLTMVSASAFVSGNWIFFWLRVMTYGELGLVDALVFTYGLLAEVPTGAISDMIGKKRTLLAAMWLASMGWLVTGAGDDKATVILGFVLASTGWAFFSGAQEALVYDSLKERGQEQRFERIIATSHTLGLLTLVVSVLAGGVLYNLWFRLPHYAWGIMYFIGFLAALGLREPAVDAPARAVTLRTYTRQLTRGFVQLWQPALRGYMPLLFGALGAYFLFSYGLIAPAMATGFGFFADEQAVVFALLGLAGAAAASVVPMLRRRLSDLHGLAIIALLLVLGFAGGALPLGAWGILALLCIRVAGGMITPWVAVVINREIPSQDRATTLSSMALLAKIPYAATAVLAGQLVEQGRFWLFSLAVAVVVLVFIGGSLAAAGRRKPGAPLVAAPPADVPESAHGQG